MVQLNFDPTKHTPLDGDVLPEGWYNFIIDESNVVPTKDGNPNHLRLVLRFSVMDGPQQGRKVFNGLNIRHTNIQTMEIANRELSAICAAVSIPYLQDSQQLHNLPLKGRVKIRKDPTGQYDDQAEIKSYKPINYVPTGGVGTAAPQMSTQSAPAAPTGWIPPKPVLPPPPANAAPPAPPMTNGSPPSGWQKPQSPQPWGQPAAPAEPHPAPAAQPAPVGFAAPTPPAATAPPAAPPPSPEVQAAQNASPPWARGQA